MSFRPNHFFVKNREISRIPLLKNATKSYDVIHSALRATLAPGRQEPEVIFIYDSWGLFSQTISFGKILSQGGH